MNGLSRRVWRRPNAIAARHPLLRRPAKSFHHMLGPRAQGVHFDFVEQPSARAGLEGVVQNDQEVDRGESSIRTCVSLAPELALAGAVVEVGVCVRVAVALKSMMCTSPSS